MRRLQHLKLQLFFLAKSLNASVQEIEAELESELAS